MWRTICKTVEDGRIAPLVMPCCSALTGFHG
jgi:hypothetical protein